MSRLTANMDINISELLAQIEVDDREEDIIREAQTVRTNGTVYVSETNEQNSTLQFFQFPPPFFFSGLFRALCPHQTCRALASFC